MWGLLISGALRLGLTTLLRTAITKAVLALVIFLSAMMMQGVLAQWVTGQSISFNPFDMGNAVGLALTSLFSFSPFAQWVLYSLGIDIWAVAIVNGLMVYLMAKALFGQRVS